ncbi:SidA/IucD/PvdA family monooxygenase [Herbaspirillum sp. ST 5-3]|uniref:SidA/IucD/PvdA family monooxygenase n=1 Tax=Oxalobacteraceae TaxID=75682 RepID=UPI0010A3AA3E|nr:SidA/IucD/PvdA family monooxygenase [Herbaspirillum sp. ST 5-3]
MTKQIYDVVGVGFGPSNLALAICLAETNSPLNVHFIESRTAAGWQSEMLLDGSDIQNNPIRDLVTLRNPLSKYSFINYLKENERLLDYLNLGLEYPLRKEYARYIQWAARDFNRLVSYSTRVMYLEILTIGEENLWKITCDNGTSMLTRSLVLGTGRSPNIPSIFKPILGPRVFHLTQYLKRISELPSTCRKIGVLGASQSAVELLIDLMNRFPGKEIYSIQRSYAFRLKDTSQFSDHVYFPEFIDYYYNLRPAGKANIDRQLRGTNYSSADGDVIHQLYLNVYEEKLDGRNRFKLLNNTAVKHAEFSPESGLTLNLQEVNTGHESNLDLDALVLATGFLDLSPPPKGEPFPPLLAPVAERLPLDEAGVLVVSRDYSVKLQMPGAPRLYLNGLCESTHGLGDAGSFSLVSLRAHTLVTSLLANRHYVPQQVDVGAALAKEPSARELSPLI